MEYTLSFYTNILKPIFWGCVAIYLIYVMKTNYIRNKTNMRYFKYVIIISAIQMLYYFYLGFLLGFSKSPYNHETISLLKNIFIKIIPIIGIEMTRGMLIYKSKNNKKMLFFITILLILVEIDYNTLISIYPNRQNLYEYICGNIIPIIAYGFLCTYLAQKGTYLINILFRSIYAVFILILPIFTNIDWFITGTGGIISPIIIYIVFKNKFEKENREKIKIKADIFSKISYFITIAFCTALSLFMLGVFKYEPITILSNSMKPEFSRNDVVIYKKLAEKELAEIPIGSIIIYSVGKKNIAHRVVDVIADEKEVKYQTKGDNNNTTERNLVKIEQIKGVYVFHIKYIGFPSVFLYQYFNNEEAEMENK